MKNRFEKSNPAFLRALVLPAVLALGVWGCSASPGNADDVPTEGRLKPVAQVNDPAPEDSSAKASTKKPPSSAPEKQEAAAVEVPAKVTPDEVCSRIRAAVIGRGDYPASKVSGCFPVESEDEDNPGFYITRLNAVCEQDVCGSVLLGWYAVETKTGRVFEWDVATLSMSEEVRPSE